MSEDSVGRLRTRVELQRPELTPDGIGGGAVTWTSEGKVWAWVQAGGGGEGAALDGLVSTTSYRIEIRMRRDVRPGWRVAWAGRTFVVRVIADADEFGARLQLICEEDFT